MTGFPILQLPVHDYLHEDFIYSGPSWAMPDHLLSVEDRLARHSRGCMDQNNLFMENLKKIGVVEPDYDDSGS